MIRMTRLTDYGIMLLTYFARGSQSPIRSARDLSKEAHLPLPTVSKLLKVLARQGLLVAHRGVKGGFTLARRPDQITVAQVIDALEGPIGVTECSAHSGGCGIEGHCIVQSHWQKINRVVLEALDKITLAEMSRPLALVEAPVEWRAKPPASSALTQKG